MLKNKLKATKALNRQFRNYTKYNEKFESLHKVTLTEKKMRIDKWLKNKFPTLTNSHLQKLIRTKKIRKIGKNEEGEQILSKVKASERIEEGEQYLISNQISTQSEHPQQDEDQPKEELLVNF